MSSGQDIDISLTRSNFDFVRSALARRVAISLTDNKEYLVINRLVPLLHRHGFASLDKLVTRLRLASGDPLWDELVDALTTNETSFFRDKRPFQLLADTILPTIGAQARPATRDIHIWSAGCSSGQEAYSIAMLAMEVAPMAAHRLRIIGSDVSASMLRSAAAGTYSELECQRGLSEQRRTRFLRRSGGGWTVRDELKQRIRWERFSLADTWPPLPLFDLVLLRNVLVYFDSETRDGVLRRVHRSMRAGGILMLGSAESMMLYDHEFNPVTTDGVTYYVAG